MEKMEDELKKKGAAAAPRDCLSIYLSTYLSISLSLSLSLYIYIYIDIYLSIHPSIYQSAAPRDLHTNILLYTIVL